MANDEFLTPWTAVRRRLRPLLAPGGVLALAAAFTGVVAAVDPNEPGHFPTCPFLALTGLYCPGCGSLRMVHALAHGHLGEAVALNVLAAAMLPVLGWLWVRWTVALARGAPARARPASPWCIRVLLAAVLVFWVARNLPLGQVLAP